MDNKKNELSLNKIAFIEKQFNNAILTLQEAVYESNVNQYVKDSTIKRFEYTYELAWSIIKQILSYKGIKLTTPRELFSKAFSEGWLLSPENWEDMIEDRNATTHTYKARTAEEIYRKIIKDYYNDLVILQININKVIQNEL